MKRLIIIALLGATLPAAYGQEEDTRQHHKFPCGADYERIRTHKPGDSPAMWHETWKPGEIRRTRDTLMVAGKKYDVMKGILSGKLEMTFNDADWTGLIIHTPKLDYLYMIESENCPYAGIED